MTAAITSRHRPEGPLPPRSQHRTKRPRCPSPVGRLPTRLLRARARRCRAPRPCVWLSRIVGRGGAACVGSSAFASPKSRIFTVLSGRT
jgi:hypothetical protein